MSSTGIISRVIAPVTGEGESKRKASSDIGSMPGVESTTRTVYGKITEVDAERALVKIRELHSETMVASAGWVPLGHTPREIAERWGKLKKGQIVSVQYRGPTAADALATIIREPGEDLTEEPLEKNEMSQGLYRIFGPGIGIG